MLTAATDKLPNKVDAQKKEVRKPSRISCARLRKVLFSVAFDARRLRVAVQDEVRGVRKPAEVEAAGDEEKGRIVLTLPPVGGSPHNYCLLVHWIF